MARDSEKLVMVVEDDSAIAEAVVEILNDAGFKTCSASNGMEAIKILQNGAKPDLILLDLMMPLMDGYQFRDEQKKNSAWSQIPVVVMSADGNISEKKSRTDANAYIKKPLDIDDLIQIVADNLT